MAFVYTVNREGRRVSVITGGELDVTAAGQFGTMLCRLAGAAPNQPEPIECEPTEVERIESEPAEPEPAEPEPAEPEPAEPEPAEPEPAEPTAPTESEPTERIEVDLGGLMFIDSTGIAALNRAYRKTSRTGCELVITNATGVVLRALELTGTLTHLTEYTEPSTEQPDGDRTEVDTGRPPA